MTKEKKFSSYTYREMRTGIGQLIEVTCRPDEADEAQKFFSSHIRTVNVPSTKKITIPHGGLGRLSRFDVKQHKYAGGRGGYIEVLEIENVPDGRCGVVVHEYSSAIGSVFYEFSSLEKAKKAWNRRLEEGKDIKGADGLVRAVNCVGLEPWFYAMADQTLKGDFVFPDVVEEDPVYRLGRKFIIHEESKLPQIKTCMGIANREAQTCYPRNTKKYKVIFWDDGTVIDEWYSHFRGEIIPFDEAETWIKEAIAKFHDILTGEEMRGTINFANGDKLLIRLQRGAKNKSHPAGTYFANRYR